MCWCAKAERTDPPRTSKAWEGWTVYSSSKKLGILICHFDLKILRPAAWLPDVSAKK